MVALRSQLRLACLSAVSWGASSWYVRTGTYEGGNFFAQFDFFTGGDPTHGFVQYVDEPTARAAGMVGDHAPGPIYMSADRAGVSSPAGRRSVRLQSKTTWTYGLFILDLQHMPSGCGTWNAFWLCGPGWPNAGEIDVLETTHATQHVQTTLHTSDGCSMNGVDPSTFTGSWLRRSDGQPASDCYIRAPGQSANQGCGILNGAGSAGSPFNSGLGGVIATEWDATGIRMWYFPRNNIPQDVLGRASPNPDGWGLPYARFDFGPECSNAHFHDHQIIFNLDFCGDWAGRTFQSECPQAGTASCADFVRNHPEALSEAYWLVNYLDVFERAGRSSGRNATTFNGRQSLPTAELVPAIVV